MGHELPQENRVSVLVADDHPAMRGALARIVADDDRLVLAGEATDGAHAHALISEHRPDVALLDVRMPMIDGFQLLRQLRSEGCPTRVLLISGNDDAELGHAAIRQGAAGFLSKEAEEDEIVAGILGVARGRTVMTVSLAGPAPEPDPVRLSARERELLTFAADGLSTPEIAAQLHLSPNTVKTYWQRLYEKLGTSDRTSALAEALRRGLLAPR